MVGSIRSGHCSCTADADCPQPGMGGLTSDQNCASGVCLCDKGGECGTNQKCTFNEGFAAPGFCHY
jgi:hypothetical protein